MKEVGSASGTRKKLRALLPKDAVKKRRSLFPQKGGQETPGSVSGICGQATPDMKRFGKHAVKTTRALLPKHPLSQRATAHRPPPNRRGPLPPPLLQGVPEARCALRPHSLRTMCMGQGKRWDCHKVCRGAGLPYL